MSENQKNQMKICSDPYRMQNDFWWRDENGEWTDIRKQEMNDLNKAAFYNSPISRIGQDIFGVIIGPNFRGAQDLEIIFEGTDEDYECLVSIKKNFYADCKEVELVRGQRRMKSAKDVFMQIENAKERIYKCLETTENTEGLRRNDDALWGEEVDKSACEVDWVYKCQQGVKYLDKLKDDVQNAKNKAERRCEEIERNIQKEMKDVLNKLEDESQKKILLYTKGYSDLISGKAVKYLDKERIKKIIENERMLCTGKDNYQNLLLLAKKMNENFQKDILEYSQVASLETDVYWGKCVKEMRLALMKDIMNGTSLSEEERNIVSEVNEIHLSVAMMPNCFNGQMFRFVSMEGGEYRKSLRKGSMNIAVTECIKTYCETLRNAILGKNRAIIEENKSRFENWTKKVVRKLNSAMVLPNSALEKQKKELEKEQNILDNRRMQKGLIIKEIEQIKQLMEFAQE